MGSPVESLWSDSEAKNYQHSSLEMRAYTSQLLGRNSDLVLHGGGNTSVKETIKNIFGEDEEILYVKGSGWDLKTIKPQGFAPAKLETLKKLASLSTLSDTDMVRELKASMINPSAPAPSVEAILHAIIPFKYVDHTHTDAVVALTNTADGEKIMQGVFGDDVLVLPYCMPGFILSKQVYQATLDINWDKIKGIVLLQHGVFTFHDDAKTSYENMIELVSRAENYLKEKDLWQCPQTQKLESPVSSVEISKLRKLASDRFGAPMILNYKTDEHSVGYSSRSDIKEIASQGPLTPDHVIQTKRIPMLSSGDWDNDLENYKKDYLNYFERNKLAEHTCLDTVPRFAIIPNRGIIAMGPNFKRSRIISDITDHTVKSHQWSQSLTKLQALPEKDIFDVEYWELEQAKLKRSASKPAMEGKIALVSGAASGIGKSICQDLLSQGCCVMGLDINPEVKTSIDHPQYFGEAVDVTDTNQLQKSLEKLVHECGGLDILVSNAGSFPKSTKIEDLDENDWDKAINLNLNSHFRVLKTCVPYLKNGIDPSVVLVASKNVPAPGPGASAYSCSKAGLTQLGRVAALELGGHGIRVNMVHPNAVFDTGIWTEEVLQSRAKHYGLSVDEYKRNNLLKREITSANVAELVRNLCTDAFARTTGAQIPIDGGNERVI